MGYATIGWSNIGVTVAVLSPGPNTITENQYLIIIPQADGDTVVGFNNTVIDPQLFWLMTIANGDPTQTMTIHLTGGLPGQNPPQIVLPPGYTSIALPPAYTQDLIYAPGTGWVAVIGGNPS